MRDTLMTGLACLGGASLVVTLSILIYLGGAAWSDWLDQHAANREAEARTERAAQKWGNYVAITIRGRRSFVSIHAEGWSSYSTVDELIADSSRRAGARGESDG